MKKLNYKDNQGGFTIIEVLIVLAIAGLIMVVVFLAVPALQRNSRNNALNTDINNLLSGVSEFSSNNGGTLPNVLNPATFVAGSKTAVLEDSSIATENPVTVKLGGSIQGLSFAVLNATTSTVTTTSAVGTAQIIVGTGAVCNTNGTNLVGSASGGTRSVAIVYAAEGSSSTSRIVKCLSS